MFSIIFGNVLNALGGSPTVAELVHQVNKVIQCRTPWIKFPDYNTQTSQPGETGLRPHRPSSCARPCDLFIFLISLHAFAKHDWQTC